jgi:glycerol-3-phosphate acyltransferase PlsY
MDPLILLLAAGTGYLLGSVSFARLIINAFAPEEGVRQIDVQVPDAELAFRSTAVSATTVNLQLGPRYGCLTSILDMLKVAAPALAVKLWQPAAPYYLILAAMGTLGHNWPVYYGFQGGRGMSTILGGMLVVDWLGILVTTAVSFGAGALLRSFYLANRLSIVLMIPWLWFRHDDWRLVAYAVAVNVLNWIAVMPEAREMLSLRRAGKLDDFLKARQVRVSDSRGGRTVERLTFYGMVEKLLPFGTREKTAPVDPSDDASAKN